MDASIKDASQLCDEFSANVFYIYIFFLINLYIYLKINLDILYINKYIWLRLCSFFSMNKNIKNLVHPPEKILNYATDIYKLGFIFDPYIYSNY